MALRITISVVQNSLLTILYYSLDTKKVFHFVVSQCFWKVLYFLILRILLKIFSQL